MACQHEHLQFQSGDYYITCMHCHLKWATVNAFQAENGYNSDDKLVGTDPTVANKGFTDLGGIRKIKLENWIVHPEDALTCPVPPETIVEVVLSNGIVQQIRSKKISMVE